MSKGDFGQEKFSLTNKGLKLSDEILWLHGEGDGNGLVFLARRQDFFAKPYRFLNGSQYIASEKLCQSLFYKIKAGRVLSCPIGQPFSLGLLTLCLFSSTDPFGGSWLLVTTPSEKILYADHFPRSLKQIPQELQDTPNLKIVLNAATPFNSTTASQEITLLEWVRNNAKTPLDLFCSSAHIAAVLIELLSAHFPETSLFLHPQIFKIYLQHFGRNKLNRIFASTESPPVDFKNKISLFPATNFLKQKSSPFRAFVGKGDIQII